MQIFQDGLLCMYKEWKEDRQDGWGKEQMATRDTYLMSFQAQDVSVVHRNMIGCDFYDSIEIVLSSFSFMHSQAQSQPQHKVVYSNFYS